MTAQRLALALDRWIVGHEQSTRAIALIRIGLGLVILTRFANELAVFRTVDIAGLILGPLFCLFTAMMIAGYMTRFAVVCVAASLFTIYLTGTYGNTVSQWHHHHVYLLLSATVLLAFTPCDRSYSVDSYRARRQADREGRPQPPELGLLWGQRLMVLQLGALYFWAAVDKSDWAWVSGQRLEQILTWTYSGRPLAILLDRPLLLVVLSLVVLVAEYGLAVGIFVRPLARFVVPVGFALHAAFYMLLPVSTYSITMMVLYLAILDPDAVHRCLDGVQGHAAADNRL